MPEDLSVGGDGIHQKAVTSSDGTIVLYGYERSDPYEFGVAFRVWADGVWGVAQKVPVGSISQTGVVVDDSGKTHFFWTDEVSGKGRPYVSHAFTHKMVFHSLFDGSALRTPKEIIDLSKLGEGRDAWCLIPVDAGAIDMVLASRILTRFGKSIEKRGFQERTLTVIGYDAGSEKTTHTKLVRAPMEPNDTNGFACRISPSESWAFWFGPHTSGADRSEGFALCAVWRRDGEWHGPAVIAEFRGGLPTDIIAVPVLAGGKRKACVLWCQGGRSLSFVIGDSSGWNSPGTVDVPGVDLEWGFAVLETTPGKVGILCNAIDDRPAYAEVRIAEPGGSPAEKE